MTEFQSYARKSFPVEAVQITPLNMVALAEECRGEILSNGQKEGHLSRQYIKVDVKFPKNEEQTRAYVGDWLVKQGRSFKVYKDKQFRQTFELQGAVSESRAPRQQKRNQRKPRPQGPSPTNMPKKRVEPANDEIQNPEAAAARRSDPPTVPPMNNPFDARSTPAREDWQNSVPVVTRERIEAEDQAHAEQVVAETRERLTGTTMVGETEVNVTFPEPIKDEDQFDYDPPEMTVETPGAPITLDELESQPGDPRTASEITSGQ